MLQQANHLNKYLDLPNVWRNHVIETRIALAQQARVLNNMANASQVKENEKLSDFVLKSAIMNNAIEQLLLTITDFLNEVAKDAEAVRDGAKLRDVIRDQSETITQLMTQRDIVFELMKERDA
jgi:hypothetical protein